MKSYMVKIVVTLAIVAGLGVNFVSAQQTSAKRNIDAEIQAALESAKTTARVEFLGTLVRTCLLSQSGGENSTDTVPAYVIDPAKPPSRNTWFGDAAKLNL